MDKRFIKGLFKDTAHIDQPEGTWRYAKNAVTNDKKGSISNEGGTELAGHLGANPLTGAQNDKVIGKIEVSDNRVILFVKDVVSSISPRSEIGIWEKGVYTILYSPNVAATGIDLNFQEKYPIEGTFKIDSKEDLVIYFTDDLNPPRAFNVSRQQRESGASTHLLYGSLPNDIELLNLFPHSGSVPHIELDSVATHQSSVIEGGGLLTAVYYLALAYVDDDFVATNFVTVSNPISIVDEFDHTIPTTKKDGAKEGSQTTKAIKWLVTNLNNDYKFLKPVIIRKMGDANEAFQLPNLDISSATSKEVVFTGIEGATPASLQDVIIDTVSYDTAKTIQQLDNVLYLGNLTGKKDLDYQKYANNIKLHSVTKRIKDFDTVYVTADNIETGFLNTQVNNFDGSVQTVDPTKSYRYQPNIFKFKGYMRDEVYAFYIAFILKDGSTSYAYHIPGRESQGAERSTNISNEGPLYGDAQNINPKYAKLFHFKDTSDGAFNDTRFMNYWENGTETYPNTDNYEIWDVGGYTGNDLKGNNVRHHHFPSNRNPGRRTIASSKCRTAPSEGLKGNIVALSNDLITFRFEENTTHYVNDGYYTKAFLNTYKGSSSTVDESYARQLWDGKVFTADQAMDVEVRWLIQYWQTGSYVGDVKTQLIKVVNGTASVVNSDTIANGSFDITGCPDSDKKNDYNSQTPNGSVDPQFSSPIHLEPGDQLYLQHKRNKNDHQVYQTHYDDYGNHNPPHRQMKKPSDPDCPKFKTFIRFKCTSSNTVLPDEFIRDVKVNHNVDVLGFELRDIKIPQAIRDKIQGFRVYYAKRDHADKTILGQAPLLPMRSHRAQIGICRESLGGGDATQILETLQDAPEDFWTKDPSGFFYYNYPTYPLLYEENPSGPNPISDAHGYKVFNFPAFDLLRSRKSISSATHINVEYITRNLVFNGPTIDQDKKMVSFIEEDGSSGIDQVTQVWGYDTDFNCYPKDVNSSIHIGHMYQTPRLTTQPRMLGQKAKTYVPGDSIFDVRSLGFGGKIFNEFGESGIAIGLKDEHELSANRARMEPFLNDGHPDWIDPNNVGNNWGYFNFAHQNSVNAAILVNPTDSNGVWNTAVAGGGTYNGSNRSKSYIANLKAFKTDVYKSIDSQDLVWTGFEVLGDDLDYFTIGNQNAHYNTDQLGTINGQDHEGIFGGDTYICRYGAASGLTPNDRNQNSNPFRAIHYHIVESQDNINFRHTQDDDSIYFPNTPAKSVLKTVGIKDIVAKDNMRYNDNYSELNTLRSAFPLPLADSLQDNFPTRTHRSAKADTTSLIDNYRIFLANQFKDLPKNRGDLWKLSSFNNLLYFHMQESLFAGKGKQALKLSDGSESFVGSGDIFQQEPDEIIQTEGGYAGTQSQWAALTTRFGYFFVDGSSRKVFLMGEQLQEISAVGMESWFKENLKFELQDYGFTSKCSIDNPVDGFGFTSIYDPNNRRIILTKREFAPTQQFKDAYNLQGGTMQNGVFLGSLRFNSNKCLYQVWAVPDGAGNPPPQWTDLPFECSSAYFTCSGWTISYSPEAGTWTSFHSYIPYIYFNTSTDFYSLTDKYNRPVYQQGVTTLTTHNGTTFGNAGIWRHNSKENRGILYQENKKLSVTNAQWETLLDRYNFEIEFVHNENKTTDTLLSNVSYTLETFNQDDVSVLQHGFTDFLLYNTLQISGVTELEYLVNTRRVGNSWNINRFRDMAALSTDTSIYYMSSNTNILGGTNTGTVTSSSTENMFIVDGMNETVNASYIDLNKTWDKQKKFTDKWVGIRLICDNKQNNLLNLYSTSVGARKVHR